MFAVSTLAELRSAPEHEVPFQGGRAEHREEGGLPGTAPLALAEGVADGQRPGDGFKVGSIHHASRQLQWELQKTWVLRVCGPLSKVTKVPRFRAPHHILL